MAVATLGGIPFRIDPDSIQYNYSIDYSIIDTLGGRVIQVVGSTISDITISGSFGQDHRNKRDSWQLAESFGAQIRALMDAQVLPPKKVAGGPAHNPLVFTYMDGVHNWNMKVFIKSYVDGSGTGSIEHTAAKGFYGYTLTLFLVEDSSLALSRVSADKFIARISKGLGWKETKYGSYGSFNGSDTLDQAIKFVQDNSGGANSFDGYLSALVSGQVPQTAQKIPPPTK